MQSRQRVIASAVCDWAVGLEAQSLAVPADSVTCGRPRPVHRLSWQRPASGDAGLIGPIGWPAPVLRRRPTLSAAMRCEQRRCWDALQPHRVRQYCRTMVPAPQRRARLAIQRQPGRWRTSSVDQYASDGPSTGKQSHPAHFTSTTEIGVSHRRCPDNMSDTTLNA